MDRDEFHWLRDIIAALEKEGIGYEDITYNDYGNEFKLSIIKEIKNG